MAEIPGPIDRQTTTPFHLKLFYKTGSFHRLDEFNPLQELPPHLQIYTWQSCTLRELSHLLTTALPSLLPDPAIGTRLSFRLVFPDTRSSSHNSSAPGRFLTKDLGSIIIGDGGPGILPDEDEAAIVAGGPMAGRLEGEPEKSLNDVKFVIGDYVACAVLPPSANGSVAPPLVSSVGGRGGFAGRGNYGGGRGDFGGRGTRENGFGDGFRSRGSRGGFGPGVGSVPSGEWRRGERIPEGPSGGGRGRGGYSGRGRW
ncbi:Sin3 associated polypeptide p18 [Phlyctema vagabunda]|uniref:Sin3 associated polypeptide p18 n=1 Tax=Phlyctema vagabunda TaxID=108571 RepID=A0ABR4PK74_9HELO